jgi:predicted XRE-type DNA-binding protein
MSEQFELIPRNNRAPARTRDGGDSVLRPLKDVLAGEVVKLLDARRLSTRAAQERTGFAAADFSRIRNADLDRFSLDRLVAMLDSLGAQVNVSVQTPPAQQ